ncbi:acidic leucine-rich nuclear phosphoprotein 32 family member B-like [Gossypium australe]|uniref:Acidic leucine-rich nuclear phosphoprotein 32 family member B-like n=1 Tax=Gossypium australe TaxID=47621 RepID=A0A5B6VW46_9ROSI|nr:acidic leucine-rich nuclear phosphoprotein 32 family member B-like [Gossypium australe]
MLIINLLICKSLRKGPTRMTILYVIKGEMQSMRTEVKQVQSECTNSAKTLTRPEYQMSQLINMMRDIKRQIGTSIPSNTKDDIRREGKKHVKAIELHLSKEPKEIAKPVAEPKDEPFKEPILLKVSFPSQLEEK